MHLHEADTRRRDGQTSWDAYGREAASAGGRGLLVRVTGRCGDKGRLTELSGIRLSVPAPVDAERP
jgi:hypothetical protein